MRIANVAGRLALGAGDRWIDVANASGGDFSSDPMAVYERGDEVRAWAATVDDSVASAHSSPGALENPVLRREDAMLEREAHITAPASRRLILACLDVTRCAAA